MDKVYLKKSNIKNAGNGLFSNKHFIKGEIITFYSGKVINIKDYEVNSDYALNVGNKIILGNKLFNNSDNAAQFINDIGSIYNIKSIKRYIETINSTNSYLVEHDNNFLAVCIKNIQPGDEIYFHYGINYWISKNNIIIDTYELEKYLQEETYALDTYLEKQEMSS